MSLRRTVDLLPEIFRTDTNRKFLGATLDQLTQEPVLNRTQGFVGRRVGPGVNPQDGYIVTAPGTRTDYQLEPGVVFLEPDTDRAVDAITYPGILDALELQGANVSRHDRLMNSEYYTWDSFCDFDKFVNYGQYYWLKDGPDPVDVFGTDVPLSNSFDVTRTDAYTFSNIAERNPVITLVRGGNYEFRVNQPGSAFWIQTAPGIAGTVPDTPNISSRSVLGVTNNGTDNGVVNINVPTKTAQDFFFELPSIGTVDLITELRFNQVNNVYVDEFLRQNPRGIDNITNLDGRTVVFINRTTDAATGGWQITSFFDPLVRTAPIDQPDALDGQPGSFDVVPFDQTTDITDIGQRYSIWQINYATDDAGRAFMRLQSVAPVPELSKFTVKFGTRFSSTEWYKTSSGVFERIPLLTAVLDTLWYQDGNNPEIFGRILLVEPGDDRILDINEIVGATQYTSPNGVRFTNGLKVKFLAPVNPAAFQGQEYYVEGVGTGPGIASRVGFVDGEAYFGPSHAHQGVRMTGAVHRDEFHQFIYDTVEESLLNIGQGGPAGSPLPATGVPANLLSNGIKLIPVDDMIVPELADLSTPDYITINRASQNRNIWSRSNRWFHIDVLKETAEYNNQPLLVDNDLRARRPIVEFRPNLELFNNGRQAKPSVNVVDFSTADAFSFVAGQASYAIDNYRFVNGSRVVFAADTDSSVRNQIWQVEFIDTDGTGNEVINLIPIANGTVLPGQNVLSLDGRQQQGKTFWFDGTQWRLAQDKTRANQPPLFDVRDVNNNSFSNNTIYPSTSFRGSRLFGYADGTGTRADDVLGFPLRYQNINNVGDIVFENYLYTDNFLFVRDNVGETKSVSDGFVREYIDRVDFSNSIGWQTAISTNTSRQVFNLPYADTLTLDVSVDNTTTISPLQIFANGKFVSPELYIFETTDTSTVITFVKSLDRDAQVEVRAISRQPSSTAYYQVPLNLESNPLNQNSNTFTLGTIRTHYETIGQNLRSVAGPIVGANNTRDLGNVARYGQLIVQNSSPLTLTGAVLRSQPFEFFKALQFNNLEYTKYKSLLLTRATEGEYTNLSPTDTLDEILSELSLGRSEVSPFYWSDMLPSGRSFVENSYTYGFTSTPTFDTVQTYNFTGSNFLGLLIYLNDRLLSRGQDYMVSADSPTVEITAALTPGDRITIREYSATYGSFVPNTPTKLGLYPAYQPEIYEDTTYITPRTVIRGHDGSVTVAFGDFRDQVLLEFETRIYNNLKVSSEIPLSTADVIPGQFRTTDYSLTEINDILTTDFLTWVGQNKLDYTTQTFVNSEPFTYNYSRSGNRLSGEPLPGAWRGIYRYFYDTDHPDTRPWEMLGLSEKPTWWERLYGPAPYTSGNRVLWDDLAAGIIRDPAGTRTDARYARPELLSVLPVDSEGNLLPPLSATVGNYDGTSFRRSWRAGDIGPAEHAWRTSSAWPFAAMRLLALTRPAEFFSLFADRDRYSFDNATAQYLWDGRYRLDANNLRPLYGNDVSTASYFNWVIDYNRQLGINSTDRLTEVLDNIDVRLCWRTRAFTDKSYLKIFTDRSSPTNTSATEILPDESYRLLLYKNQPFERVTYSSVIVQQTSDGWAVLGYDQQRPFFTVFESRPAAGTQVIISNESQVRVAVDFTDQERQIPYGFVFTTRDAVCDFLVSYGERLKQKGLIFESRENGLILDWSQMCQEFLTWSQQGWGVGSILNLNPGATSIAIERADAVVDSLKADGPESVMLNQNRQALVSQDLVIDRLDNLFKVTSVTDNTINFVSVKFTAYEHMLVLDNRSIFADVIYEPVTGARQSRVKVAGWLTGNWTGTPNAPGFVINQDTVQTWAPNRRYAKGDIVEFKGEFWTASTAIAPSETFDVNLWLTSNYNLSRKGLLPNAAAQSVELTQAFSSNSVNLEQEVDLFSYGLIGFRPRQYMQNLNLDDVSQVNVYREFLDSKGTLPSAELFGSVDLGKEQANYNITEYWAALRSQYGATANRNYVEFLLDRAKLSSDPSLVELIGSQQGSVADQTVALSGVWKSSTKLQSTQVFPSKLSRSPKEINLPSAGFVNLDDVDIAEFDLDQLASADQLTRAIREGSTIWLARIDKQDWGIFTARLTPGNIVSVSDNLNDRARVIFDQEHRLAVGDILVIKFFDPVINGIYRIRSVTDSTSVLIDFDFDGAQTEIDGVGVGLTLSSLRVAQPADIVNLPIAETLEPGVKIWVDNNGNDQWQVLEKSNPFTIARQKTPADPVTGSKFGAAVAQGLSNLGALVGAPEFNPDNESEPPGAVYTYLKTPNNVYEENSTLTLDVVGAAGYGNAISIGDQDWAVVGASRSNSNRGYAVAIFRAAGSNAFEQRQLLLVDPAEAVTNNDEFGFSVALSQNERWMYVGAPGGNRVYAYTRIDVPQQAVTYTATGSGSTFNYADSIVIDDKSQLVVSVAGRILGNEVGYLVDVANGNIVFAIPPAQGATVRISRRSSYINQLPVPLNELGDGSNREFSFANNFAIVDPAQLLVLVDGDVRTVGNANDQYQVDVDNSLVIFNTPPDNEAEITITLADPTIGEADSKTTVDLTSLFSATSTESATVSVNGVLQRPGIDYMVDSNRLLTFDTLYGPGTLIVIRARSYWKKVNELSLPNAVGTEKFGHSVTTTTDGRKLIVGAPGVEINSRPAAGKVYVYDRLVQNFQVVDPEQRTYTTVETINEPANVFVNGKQLIETIGGIDNQYNITGNTVTIDAAVELSVGDVITVDVNQFVLEQEFESGNVGDNYQFGFVVDQCVNDCSLYVSSPFADGESTVESGQVEFFTNQARVYGTIKGTEVNPELNNNSTEESIRINNFYVTATGTTVESLAEDINNSQIPNVFARVDSGRLVIQVKNISATRPLSRLQVAPGTGTLFDDVGFAVYVPQQTIVAPVQQDRAFFGKGLFISDDAVSLLVGAPNATAIRRTTFDNGQTTFDANSTVFTSSVLNSGVVYAYDYLLAANESVENFGQFVFGQQILSQTPETGTNFGSSVDYTTGTLLIGAPDCSVDSVTAGCVASYRNPTQGPAWKTTRLQQPVVDVDRLNTTFLYNRQDNIPAVYLDYFDPLQGRLLGAVAENINYIGAVDPAAYNIGTLNNFGRTWQAEHVGEIWWNTSQVRFIDPNQDDLIYASRRWGQLFPGSRVEVYQWTASDVPPNQYTGPGTPASLDNFAVSSRLNDQGIFVDEFYFWVTGINTVNTVARKTLSIDTIARYIENPRASGIPYVAIINPSTVAIYNSLDNITSQDTVLHIEYDRLLNDSAVHTEYQLIAEDRADGFLTDDLYRKLQDSLCGVNENGAVVPDPLLNVGEKYGIAARPRQGMFVNRFAALENYLTQVNRVLKQEPVTESRRFTLLNSAEPEPASFSSAWDKRVVDVEELSFQNLRLVPVGYRYLVASDLNFQGRWAIYQVVEGATTGSRELDLARVQTFDTRLYWKFVDWFRVDYNPAARISAEVAVVSGLETLTVPVGSSVRVLSNPQGKWEIYQLNNTGWQRVGLQDGTIEISDTLWDYQLGRYGFDIEVFDAQFYDQEPTVETRKIIQAINQDLLTDNLAIERNRLLILMFNYILSEQRAPEWLTKTSLVDVDHTVRQLLPFPSFSRDNQEFVIDYITEVKPYHTQIREFNLIYQGQDLYDGSATDFDLPAFWDEEQKRFVSPVLDDLGTLSTTSSTPNDSETWNTFPWNQWYQNRFLEIDSVKIVDGGTGYTVPPQVTVSGDCAEPAVLIARVDSLGRVSEIEVVSPGCDYVTTPIITITGGNGTGARAAAVMANRLVRNIKTVIKYDRYEYKTSVVPWQAGVSYAADSLVRFADRVWRAKQLIQSSDFNPDQWDEVPAQELSGVDRTMGYYVPAVNQPGLDLALLMSGIDYPGVQVKGVSFDFEPGFDLGTLGFDVAPFDNLDFGPEGRPTYDPDILDAIYQSQYTDTYLGTLPAPAYNGNPPTEGPNPIVVDGGEFVDTYSSHAPEELVPGAIFDTLDMRVFTTPGADWSDDGHGFPSATRKFVYHSSNSNQFDFGDLLPHPSVIQVWNQTRRALLTQGRDYTVSWNNKTVTVVLGLGATDGEVVVVTAYELGGGNQLFVNSHTGDAVSGTLTIPVEFGRIDSVAVFANGAFVPGVTASESPGKQTLLAIPGSYGPADYLTVTVLGVTAAPVYSWSVPTVENFVATGSNTFVLTNSLSGTNPANLIVTKNGIRARPAVSAKYISDGTTIDYPLPVPFDAYDQIAINDSDVGVYVNSVKLILGVDYTVTPFDVSSDRVVLLNEVPIDGSTVLISVDTDAQYTITDNVLTWKSGGAAPLAVDDRISVITWNDTREQDLLTLVYQGPRTSFQPAFETFDPLPRDDAFNNEPGSFDFGSVTGQSGSFDFSGVSPVAVNRFELGRTVAKPDRLAVTLNGSFLFENVDYTVEGTELVILGPTIGSLQVVAVTLVTDNTVPPAVAFRLFHDMRGQQATYRITDATTVRLTQPVALDDDIIHVDRVARLSVPNLELGIFGFVTINSERISYRSRDTENNTISGLRRGTAGTGAAAHAVGTPVYDIGVVNLLPSEYQTQAKREDFIADGSTSQFVTEDISINLIDIDSAVEVRVGGILQDSDTYTVDSVNPVSVTLDQAPAAGVEVTVSIHQGLSWYEPGATTPSNGVPLQDQNTLAARFIRGI